MEHHQSLSLVEYTRCLSESGATAFLGSEKMAWTGYIKGVVSRLPPHCTDVPTRSELNAAFRHNCFIASYLIKPDPRHPANKWLYLVDRTYDIQKLGKRSRHSIHIAQRRLRFTDLSWDEVRRHGEAAFCQTKARLNLPETTRDAFLQFVAASSRTPGHVALGAWLEDRLIAFSTNILVDDWVEGVGLYSTDADRAHCPSDGLYHHEIETFLFNGPYRVITNGVTGVTDGLNPGLHQFKLKTGYQAIPVHRTFATPLWVRPLLNPMTLLSAKAVLRLYPNSLSLRRGVKTLDDILHPPILPVDQENGSDET